jgi:hypothetical protein
MVNKLMRFVEHYNLMIVLLYVCVSVCVFCVCVCVCICVIVSTGVLNCIVLYLHLKIMSYCQYAIKYSNHKNIRYLKNAVLFHSILIYWS